MKLSTISISFLFTPKVNFISQQDTEHGYSASKQMVGIRRKELLEEHVTLEDVMATKELRKTKVSFDTYGVPKTVVGVFFSYITKEKVLFQEGRESCKNEVLMTNWNIL